MSFLLYFVRLRFRKESTRARKREIVSKWRNKNSRSFTSLSIITLTLHRPSSKQLFRIKNKGWWPSLFCLASVTLHRKHSINSLCGNFFVYLSGKLIKTSSTSPLGFDSFYGIGGESKLTSPWWTFTDPSFLSPSSESVSNGTFKQFDNANSWHVGLNKRRRLTSR